MKPCQVDFYLLGSDHQDPRHLACKLALMALERGHRIDIITAGSEEADRMDELLWEFPEQRFIPHDRHGGPTERHAPVRIGTAPPKSGDVVINLTPEPLTEPQRCRRLLEIVPHRKADREASRSKYRAYTDQGLQPATHEIN